MSQDYQNSAYTVPTDNNYNYNYYYDPRYQTQPGTYPVDANQPSNYPVAANQPSAVQSWFDFSNNSYAKGFVVGAAVALVLANPTVQKAIVGGAVKLWSGVQGGVEEVKERIHDIKAEMSTKE